MHRVALAFAYDGTRFDSYARQPGKRTVEGELVRVLAEGGALTDPVRARFRSGSRTDAGVSAVWNVAAFDTELPEGGIVAADRYAPEGLYLRSVAAVPNDFNPRHATRRVYVYDLPKSLDVAWDSVREAARLFEGEHDFSNFRRADGDKSPGGRLDRVAVDASRRRLQFEAPAFLWHQVRRIVAALIGVGQGRLAVDEVRRALEEPTKRRDFGLASAEGLLLVRVDYDGVRFPAANGATMGRLVVEREAARRRLRILERIASEKGPTTRR